MSQHDVIRLINKKQLLLSLYRLIKIKIVIIDRVASWNTL